MARITVEDCLDHVDNRFDLVLLATKRARQLAFGTAEPLVPWENDKPTVVALREIAEGMINEQVIKDAQTRAEPEVIEAEIEVGAGAPFQASIDITQEFSVAVSSEPASPAEVAQPTPAPEQAAPEQAAPEQTAPEQAAPEQTAPEQAAPEQPLQDNAQKED